MPAKGKSTSYIRAIRLLRELELLRAKPRSAKELAQRLDTPVRTVQRDLALLRSENYGVKHQDGSYTIATAPAPLNPVEALTVYAATRLLYHHDPASAANPRYMTALEKLAAYLPEDIRTLAQSDIGDRPQVNVEGRTFELLARGWLERHVVSLEYLSASGSGAWRKKELEVYFIEVNKTNLDMYAIAYERKFHKRILTWKLARMRHVMLLKDNYTIPESFSPSQYLQKAWGVMGSSGGALVCVQLKFVPEVKQRLIEGGFPNLQIEALDRDGYIHASVEVGTDDEGFPLEVLSWVQSWGARVEVLAPANLRERWIAEARTVAQLGE